MWYLWMDLGTGNANFFYAITLLWAAWQVNAKLLPFYIPFVYCVAFSKQSCAARKLPLSPVGHLQLVLHELR